MLPSVVHRQVSPLLCPGHLEYGSLPISPQSFHVCAWLIISPKFVFLYLLASLGRAGSSPKWELFLSC